MSDKLKDPSGQPSAPWLDLARRQSRELAEQRAAQTRPLSWPERPAPAWRRAPLGLRLSWAVGLLVILASGITATWAYVVVVKKAQKVQKVQVPAKDRPRTAKKQRPRRKQRARRAKPAPAAQPPRLAETPAVAPKPRGKQARKAKKAATAPAADPAAGTTDSSKTNIIFGDPMLPGGGEVIIVSPPAKLGPLFSPKAFKERGPRGMSW